jgi:hypothetical protein
MGARPLGVAGSGFALESGEADADGVDADELVVPEYLLFS